MNKLANTFLDAADSLMAIHFAHPGQEDWPLMISYLIEAMRALDQEQPVSGPRVFRHDFTPEELAQQEKLLKPLTLNDLKQQVDAAFESNFVHQGFRDCGPDWNPETGLLWLIGDFEIRRRK